MASTPKETVIPEIRISAPDGGRSPPKQEAPPFKGFETGVKPADALQHILGRYTVHHNTRLFDFKQIVKAKEPLKNAEIRVLKRLIYEFVDLGEEEDVELQQPLCDFVENTAGNDIKVDGHFVFRIVHWDTNPLREEYERLVTREGLAWLLKRDINDKHFDRELN